MPNNFTIQDIPIEKVPVKLKKKSDIISKEEDSLFNSFKKKT